MRKRGKIDTNHSEIVKDLRKAGCSVQSLASIGDGTPDLLVGFQGGNYLFEVKNGNSPLTIHEHKWHLAWNGHVRTVRSSEEVFRILGLLK